MNQLVAASPRKTAVSPDLQTINNNIPAWLQYLIGAYPQAKTSPMTYAVFEDQFRDIAADVMLAAVKVHVAGSVFWPSIAELSTSVKAASEAAELKQVRAARIKSNARIAAARARRGELLERAYHGDFDQEEWAALANEFEALGHDCSAAWTRNKAASFTSS